MLKREDLHDYQRYAVDFIKRKQRCFLCLDMGLGKTTSTLTAFTDLIDSCSVTKTLVIAPLRVANSVWDKEVAGWEHLKHLKVAKILGSERKRMAALREKADIYTINRENVEWLVRTLGSKWDFDAVIIDESSSFKDPSTNRFKALKRVLHHTNYMVLLTGTPSPNSLLNLWSQCYLIDFGLALGRTYGGFTNRFFEKDYMGYNMTIRKGCDDVITKLIEDYTITMNADDYLELPDRIDLNEKVTLSKKALDAYLDFERELLIEIEDDEYIEAANAAVLANKLLQYSSGALYTDEAKNYAVIHNEKINAMKELVELNDENMLVAYNFKSDLERLKKAFPEAVVLDKNQSTIDDWNEGKIKMLLAHPACLHPSTEVLTEKRGWVRIVDVTKNERVFDGVEFVNHSGCQFSGVKPVIDVFGITMTHNHKLLIGDEWVEAKNVSDSEDVRRKALYEYKGNDRSISEMFKLRGSKEDTETKCSKSQCEKVKVLRDLHKRHFSQYDWNENMANMERCCGKNNITESKKLQGLRWSWDMALQGLVRLQELLQRYVFWLPRQFNFRPYRQRKRLLQGKLSMGYQCGSTIEQKKQSLSGVPRSNFTFSGAVSNNGYQSRGDNPTIKQRYDYGRSRDGLSEIEIPEKQKVSKVYDLVDCGKRNRFLVRNSKGEMFISHNSAGHGLNLQRGGSLCVWFSLNWSLELYQQFNARLHRQGQTKPVRIIHLISEGTIDQRVLDVLASKDATQSKLMETLRVNK